MNVALAQKNFVAGDLIGNFGIIKSTYEEFSCKGCDLLIFSELAICGYPIDDLLQKSYFIDEVQLFLDKIVNLTADKECAILIGAPLCIDDTLYNSAVFIKNGMVQERFLKNNLPNYKLFDEKRYFSSFDDVGFFDINNKRFSVLICEDVWNLSNLNKVKKNNSDALIIINASPFAPNKDIHRIDACSRFALGLNCPIFYVNQVGAIDSFVFDGSSFVMNEGAEVVVELPSFSEDVKMISVQDVNSMKSLDRIRDLSSDLYSAAVLALRDYIYKTGFEKVVIGMSGGIDSALVATIASDAIGPNNVRLIALPTKFNSQNSFEDAKNCAENLSIKLENISIQNILDSTLLGLESKFKGYDKDTTEENIQSRIRGMILMAISNKFNELLITTGNKSEMATGYATIYGDMNGAFNPIKDLYKTQIFSLANWRNNNIPKISAYKKINLIPKEIIIKEPSAELDFDQKDSDSLPDYEILDDILYKLIEEEKSTLQIIKETGYEEDVIKKIVKLFYQNEYKRKQSAPGPKLSKMSFDRDRRYLITNKFWQ